MMLYEKISLTTFNNSLIMTQKKNNNSDPSWNGVDITSILI